MLEANPKASQEWELMYRQGLNQSQIANLCRQDLSRVNRAIGWAKRRDPRLQREHEANLPAAKPKGLAPEWVARADALRLFMAEAGLAPSARSRCPEEKSLGTWLQRQRQKDRAGLLNEEQRLELDKAGQWNTTRQAQISELSWQENLRALTNFVSNHGRFPTYKAAESESERALGTWLHVQRQSAVNKHLPPQRSSALDDSLPGWNTWRGRRAKNVDDLTAGH
ncbi:helicase associated domain-containing protein [Arthrobacter sp. SW1]|uniref:helicase associated domain-containing protein n=1 Tax=Arthrobacter sp. SW1 TaxID=1920889 RepID=UPI0009435DAE